MLWHIARYRDRDDSGLGSADGKDRPQGIAQGTGDELQTEKPLPLDGTGEYQIRRETGLEAEATIIRFVPDQQHGGVIFDGHLMRPC